MSRGLSWYDGFALQSPRGFRLLLCCFFIILWVLLSSLVQGGSPLHPQSGQQGRGKGEGEENTSPFKGKTQKVQTSLLLPSHSSELSYMANWLLGRLGRISLFWEAIYSHIFNYVLLWKRMENGYWELWESLPQTNCKNLGQATHLQLSQLILHIKFWALCFSKRCFLSIFTIGILVQAFNSGLVQKKYFIQMFLSKVYGSLWKSFRGSVDFAQLCMCLFLGREPVAVIELSKRCMTSKR